MALQIVAKPSLETLRLSMPYRSTPIASTSRSLSFTIRASSCVSSSRSSLTASQCFNGVLLSLTASVAIALSAPSEATIASAATIKMGADEGSLVFVPSSISIPAGEKVIFLNNKGFPHNVIFERDGVPEGVQVELISHDDYMNEQGEQFVVTLKEKGTYRFFCEPHRAAGMFGEITVT
ncbi:hypothetical protein GOP47_0019161 [Adiantum capillus-veneris]|uniref:Plastocyanin n=1 Tax=Adiantum capillus-veneris TaxID=13818 RepID=A0A9D4UF51_ADICA|nr:hypothetical protein GOP47_0019161 [Adiantum capillus-veneris]